MYNLLQNTDLNVIASMKFKVDRLQIIVVAKKIYLRVVTVFKTKCSPSHVPGLRGYVLLNRELCF